MPPGLTPEPSMISLDVPEGRVPAKTYKFELDPFQKAAVACIERDESVLVSAHTSAGKTVCAEYAIATSLRETQRVLYTSPIKALSNQKYRELKETFGDVGLITGDVTIAEESSCLVMTTEVLRVMLHRGSATVREIKWVIFDELHLIGSPDRGWVVEEALILLPHAVRFVLLSATVPNAFELAEWVAGLHGQPTHVVQTAARPTPPVWSICIAAGPLGTCTPAAALCVARLETRAAWLRAARRRLAALRRRGRSDRAAAGLQARPRLRAVDSHRQHRRSWRCSGPTQLLARSELTATVHQHCRLPRLHTRMSL